MDVGLYHPSMCVTTTCRLYEVHADYRNTDYRNSALVERTSDEVASSASNNITYCVTRDADF